MQALFVSFEIRVCYNGLVKKLITIIIPAYNEEKSLPSLFERLENLVKTNHGYNFEFLFINDGSKDKTLSILQQISASNPHISYLNFSRNFGKEIAVAAGIDHADGDAVVIMDADGQEPPELIPEMIKWWEQGYDDVYARRNKRREGWVKRLTSRLYYRTLQSMTRIPIQLDTGDFRLFSRRCVLALRQFREVSRQNKALFSWIGYKKKEVSFDQGKRTAGDTKWKFGILSPGNSLINLAIDGFTSFTTIPLRFVTLFGLLISAVSAIYIVVIIVQALMGLPRTGGFNTLLIITLFLGGVQMISLGIIGEYVGRIFTETKNRPLYLVEEYHKAKVVSNDKKDEPKKPTEK
jgi:glycosyltransferase involved in cell wall biosynthesis